MKATLESCFVEVGAPDRGRPSYRWAQRWWVVWPDGKTKTGPPMTRAEARIYCAEKGWELELHPTCQYCGSLRAAWHGPANGRREFCCSACYEKHGRAHCES